MDKETILSVALPGAKREPSYLFARKVKFSANQELSLRRSKVFMQPKPVPDTDIWKRKPPDFSVKLYRSLQLPKQSTENQWEEMDMSDRLRFFETVSELYRLEYEQFPNLIGRKESPKLVTRFPHIGPYEANLMFVKDGKFHPGAYKDPKPHDFRQYEIGIPDFNTSYTRDPSNLKLRSQALHTGAAPDAGEDRRKPKMEESESARRGHEETVYGLPPIQEEQKGPSKFTTFQPQEPKWDSRLILPTGVYPPKSASFTRHRRRRGVYSAFLGRVEEKLTKTWQEMDNSFV